VEEYEQQRTENFHFSNIQQGTFGGFKGRFYSTILGALFSFAKTLWQFVLIFV
jgi:hypothetical protein